MKPIETQRLLLREFQEDDWQAVHEYGADPEVVRYMSWGPNTEDQTRDFITRQIASQSEEPRSHYGFAVVLKASNQLIGGIGLNVLSPENREGWIGYCFARRFWGKGYATEAARATVAFGFRALGMHRIGATCDPRNIASARVLEKTGMQREGCMREHTWEKGKWRDSLLYAILEHEWQGRAASCRGR